MEDVSNENRAELEKRYRTTVFIVAAQVLFTIVLIVASFFITPNAAENVSPETLRTLWIVIIFIAVGIILLRRIFLRWSRLRDIASLKGIKGLLKTLQTNAIILATLAQMNTVNGLVIAHLSGEEFYAVQGGIVALILLAINFPRKSVWEKIAANLQEV